MAVHKPHHPVRVNPKYYDHPEHMKDNRGDHWRDLSLNRAQFDHILEHSNPDTLSALDRLWSHKQKDPFYSTAELGDLDQYPWLNQQTALKAAADLRASVDTATASLPHYERTAFCESIVEELIDPFTGPVLQVAESYGLTRNEDRTPAFDVLTKALDQGLREIQRHRRSLTDLLCKPNERDWTDHLRAAEIATTLNRTREQAADTIGRTAALVAAQPAAATAAAIFIPAIRLTNQISRRTGNILQIYLNDNPDTHQDNIVRRVSELWSRHIQAETEHNLAATTAQQATLAQDLSEQTLLTPKANLCERAMLNAFQTYQGYQPGHRPPQHLHLQSAFNEATAAYTPEQRREAAQIVAEAINWHFHKDINRQPVPAETKDELDDPLLTCLRRKRQELLRIEANSRLTRTTQELAQAIANTDQTANMSATGFNQAREALSHMPNRWNGYQGHVEFQDPEMAAEYELTGQRITERIAELLRERPLILRAQPSTRDLLRDPAHNRTMSRFLKPYDDETKRNLMAHLLKRL